MTLAPVDTARDHTLGDLRSAALIVAYGDFECPYSAGLARSVGVLRERMGDRFGYVFRHFPLREIHPHAQAAAEAAEAAALEGRFWEAHDLLFARRRELRDLPALLERAGLALDLQSDRLAARVEEDVMSGRAAGVRGTPTIFLNGERYSGFYDAETLHEELEFLCA
jgi:protein-disulfide isomerase